MTTKLASLVYFYFGEESYLNRLAQETVPLRLALVNYERTVLLHHETKVGPIRVSGVDEKHASIIDTPTKEHLVEQLNDLGGAGFAIDLYIFAHGWPGRFLASNGTYGDNGAVSSEYLRANVRPGHLRAVWQCNCYGSTLNPTWLSLGAKVSAGSRFVNFYPTRFRRFIDPWMEGRPFDESLERADTAPGYKTATQAYILADAVMCLGQWNGNVLEASAVLGRSPAAERYFRACWLGNDWIEGKSGKDNMAASSKMLVAGDGNLLWGTR